MKSIFIALAAIALGQAATPDSLSTAVTNKDQLSWYDNRGYWHPDVQQPAASCNASTTCQGPYGSYQVYCYVSGNGCSFNVQLNVGVSCTGYMNGYWGTYWSRC